MPIEYFNQNNGVYKLKLTDIDNTWTLDEPEFWNSSHDTVKLVEEFADGNPSLLEYVYIRPENKNTNSDLRTISNENGWEIALEKPKIKQENTKDENTIPHPLVIMFFIYVFLSILAMYLITNHNAGIV